jgi:methane monooxygenase PmoA-like
MRDLTRTLLVLLLLPLSWAAAGEPILIAVDEGGAAGRVGAPASMEIDLATVFGGKIEPERLQIVELNTRPNMPRPADAVVQFVPDAEGSSKGTLWWTMTPGVSGERHFTLKVGDRSTKFELTARTDEDRLAVDVSEGSMPVLRYNQGTVPPPAEIVEHFEKQKKPPFFYARGDYIHPVYGPDGEELTDDYSMNHPHHRGICWAWPVVCWKGESRDIWAVRVLPEEPGGVWARPVSLDRVEAGPVLALIEAENVWKWGDEDPIVQEFVTIRAFRGRDRCRFIDVDIRLVALVDDLSIGGRPSAGYGGFTFRTYPEFDQRKIDMHIDPASATPREAWFHLTGNFPGGKGAAGMALMEHVTNPDYPSYPDPQTSDRIPDAYPRWRTVQPAWPGDRKVPLAKGEPLVLKHRLWIHPGLSDDKTLSDVWAAYAQPVSTSLEIK